MKLIVYRVGNSLILAVLMASLISSLLVDSPRICVGGDIASDKICPSPCLGNGEYCTGENTEESQGRAVNPEECSDCLDMNVGLLYWSTRSQWVNPEKTNSGLLIAGRNTGLSGYHAGEFSTRSSQLARGSCPIYTQSLIESTVLRC